MSKVFRTSAAPRKHVTELCDLCGDESLDDQYHGKPEGDVNSPILIIGYSPTLEEAERGRLWCTQEGQLFRSLMDRYFVPLYDVCSTVLIRCPYDTFYVRHVRNCMPFLQDGLLKRKNWRLIICLGRDVLKHVFLRGGAPPSMATLAGRMVEVPEHPGRLITVLPEPYCLVMGDGADTVSDVKDRRAVMVAALERLNKGVKSNGTIC